ncbi:SDR family NAD(P)-dependent oxidoreductase [Kribbella sp. CA-253562]|uniref:SDR family NAD(P)-dependent oxidoreductase n=1 Tax=Kribbella sp. CA-253562 TaxID=3239942 RepID=UPI003D92AB6F
MTGGTGGIGRAVAIELARQGHRVIIVGRSESRGAEVISALERVSSGRDHRFVQADLSLLSETDRAAEAITQLTGDLDALVLCAGILSTVAERTEEGLERTFVLNYLSRYLLIRRLLPLIAIAPSGRVVIVANAGKYRDTLDMDDLQLREGGRGLSVSGRTQFANDLLAFELAERTTGTNIAVACVFPGPVATEVFDNARGLSRPVRLLTKLVQRMVGASAEDAARLPVSLACGLDGAQVAGGFFGPKGKLRIPQRVSNPKRRAELWNASEELVKPWLRDQPASSTEAG